MSTGMRARETRQWIWPRVGRLVTAMTAVALAVGCAWREVRPLTSVAEVRVLAHGSRAQGDLGFRFQDLSEPLLAELAAREGLPAVVRGESRQFDQLVKLRDWVASQWPAGTPNPEPPWNALIVLDWIRAGRTGGFCAQYSQVFLQSAAALGFTARYVEIGSRDNPYAHYVTEVWSDDYDKWVVMDADYNVHFERHGTPLSALEIRDALLSEAAKQLDVRTTRQRDGHSQLSRWPLRTAELYYYVRFHLKADHLTKPDEPRFDRFNDMVEWDDDLAPAWEDGEGASEFPRKRLTQLRTNDRRLAEPRLNQIFVEPRSTDAGVELHLQHNVREFREFEYRISRRGQTGAWRVLDGDVLHLAPVADGRLDVEIRGVNIRGVHGPSARASVGPVR